MALVSLHQGGKNGHSVRALLKMPAGGVGKIPLKLLFVGGKFLNHLKQEQKEELFIHKFFFLKKPNCMGYLDSHLCIYQLLHSD